MRMVLTIGLLAGLLITVGGAASFYFTFHQTPYFPSNYSWTEPWQVKQKVDFVEATLDLTGSSYQAEPHNYILTLKNVATEPTYVITNMTYSTVWNNGSASEAIKSGTYNNILGVGKNATFTGVFTPTLVGTGSVNMTISSIVWAESKPITWTTNIVNPEPHISVTDFTVTGASKTYLEKGNVSYAVTYITGTSSQMHADCKAEIVELGITVANNLNVELIKGSPANFNYQFGPVTQNGTLTMRLTLSNIVNG